MNSFAYNGGQLIGSPSKTVHIYNPLHNVLKHFVQRLTESLVVGNISSELLRSCNGEVGNSNRTKAIALGSHLFNVRRHVHANDMNIVAWPLLGWWEMPLWRHPTHRTFITMHDPEPLVKQGGLSPRAAKYSAALTDSKWPHLVTMSPEAHEITRRYFDPSLIHIAPHPMRVPDTSPRTDLNRTVLVLGQYKAARDLDVMGDIAHLLHSRGWEPVVAGRGWPPLPGWRVINKFLSEDEFYEQLKSAAVLLLPYQYYFQSGVALRALEAGVPVVGRETGFLTSILGANFPGAVTNWGDTNSWVAAVEAAILLRRDQLDAAAIYSVRGSVEWHALITGSST